jgi:hypothetical protein
VVGTRFEKKRSETSRLGKWGVSQGEGEGGNARNPSGAPNRERGEAMNSVAGSFDDERNGFEDAFP